MTVSPIPTMAVKRNTPIPATAAGRKALTRRLTNESVRPKHFRDAPHNPASISRMTTVPWRNPTYRRAWPRNGVAVALADASAESSNERRGMPDEERTYARAPTTARSTAATVMWQSSNRPLSPGWS